MSAKEFVIRTAVDAFNTAFGTKHTYDNFDCLSLPSGDYDRCFYEVFTRKHFDYLRLRLSCQLSNKNWVGPYQLTLAVPTIVAGLGDEVWYANAQLDTEFLFAGQNYIRRTCPIIRPDENIVLATEDLEGILTEDGFEILISKVVR